MRLYITVILSLYSGLWGFAQQQPQASVSEGSTRYPHTVLWEISGMGLQQPSYLFGTMHLLCTQDALISDSLQYVLNQVKEAYFEIDMDNMSEMLSSFRHIWMKDNVSLKDLYSPAEYERVREYLKKNPIGFSLTITGRVKPMFLSAMLSSAKMPCDKKKGMEDVLLKELKARKKEVRGLESVAFQAGIFDSVPYKEQALGLLLQIDSAEKSESTTLTMIEAYKMQDLDAMEKLTLEDVWDISGYLDIFLYNRNANWIPIMQKAMKEKPLLFAVGAAHLPGKKGVIQLLRNAGYTLRPVKNLPYQKRL